MRITRFTDTGIQTNDGEGWERPMPYPFFLWSIIGFWRPACVKHKQIFQFASRYYRDHAYCEGGTFPDSDLAVKSGFRKVWLP